MTRYKRFIAIETFKLTSLEGHKTIVKKDSVWESLSEKPYISNDPYWPLAEIKNGKLTNRQVKIPVRFINEIMRQKNPIKSAEQYGLMQAVASGVARVKGISKKVAEKLIHETPEGLRREFATLEAAKRSNPSYLTVGQHFVLSPDAIDNYGSKYKGKVFKVREWFNHIGTDAHGHRGYDASLAPMRLYEANGLPFAVYDWEVIAVGARRNPGSTAEDLTTRFHGRPPKETVDISESESYESDLAQLGELTELEILTEDGEDVIPISFSREDSVDVIRLCSTPNGRQLEFIGGDQSLELEDFEEAGLEIETGKREVVIGPVHSISYWTDKHHLAGDKKQEDGVEFIHEFSEESGGRLPMLVYDIEDERMKLVGGRYTVEAEGIKD